MKEDFLSPGWVKKKPEKQYEEKNGNASTSGYDYGQTKRKLRVGLEVEWGSGGGNIVFWNGTKNRGSGTWTLAFTGLWFTPKWVKFRCQSASTPSSGCTWYATWVGRENCMLNLSTVSLLTNSHLIRCGTGSSINETTASLSSFDSDGFTINWTLNTHTINYQWEAGN